MAANFLHGIETIEVDDGARPIRLVKTAVIGLVGTAPTGPVNEPQLLLTEAEGAAFGTHVTGFSIPESLKAIYDSGVGTIIAINVLDPEIHNETVSNEEIEFDGNGRARLKHPAIITLEIKTVQDTPEICTVDIDYTLNEVTGDIQIISGGKLSEHTEATAEYKYADPSKVTAGDIIGTVDVAGKRTGLQAFTEAMSMYGFSPKILIAPSFSTLKTVSTAMISMAEKLSAIAYIDAPTGLTPQQAIAGRGTSGSINFNTSSERARLCYPHVLAYDSYADEEKVQPLSARAAGMRAQIDLDRGYWWSNSNHEIPGITGLERYLTAQIDDPNCEVNLLNEVGITTVFNGFGTGYRLWGNRTAAWPTVTHIKNFESVRRTADMINESLRVSSMQFIDRPINQALIDALVESGCAFMRKLVGDGAIIGGTVWYDTNRNPKEELALGHLLLSYKFTAPPPLERLTQESEISDEYLLTLKGVS